MNKISILNVVFCTSLLLATGCDQPGGGGTAATENEVSDFDKEHQTLIAALEIGVTADELRVGLQKLNAASSGTEQETEIVSIYQDSLEFMRLQNHPAASQFTSLEAAGGDGSLGVCYVQNGRVNPDLMRPQNKSSKHEFLSRLWDIAKRHNEIVRSTSKQTSWMDSVPDKVYYDADLYPDALSRLWSKAANIKNKSE